MNANRYWGFCLSSGCRALGALSLLRRILLLAAVTLSSLAGADWGLNVTLVDENGNAITSGGNVYRAYPSGSGVLGLKAGGSVSYDASGVVNHSPNCDAVRETGQDMLIGGPNGSSDWFIPVGHLANTTGCASGVIRKLGANDLSTITVTLTGYSQAPSTARVSWKPPVSGQNPVTSLMLMSKSCTVNAGPPTTATCIGPRTGTLYFFMQYTDDESINEIGRVTWTTAVNAATASLTIAKDDNRTEAAPSSGPTLTSSTPADDATDVAPGSTIVLNFSEAVLVNSGNLRIVNDSDDDTEGIDVTAPAGKFAWSNGNQTLTITPGSALAAGKNYHLEIDATAFRNASSVAYPGISGATTLNFAVTSGPTFSAVSPANNAYLKSSSTIQYTLNKTVNSASLTFTRSGGEADAGSPRTCTLQGTALQSGAARSIGLTSNANGCSSAVNLVDGAVYTVDLSATDTIPLTGTASITGVTYDATRPGKHPTTPITANDVDNSGTYTQGDTLTLTFSEPIDASRVTTGTVLMASHDFGNGWSVAPVSPSGGYASVVLQS